MSSEFADEDFLALLQEWEAIASVAPTVVFRDIPHSSPGFEVGKETDTLRFFLRTLRAQVENRLGYPQPPASFVDENFRKPLTYRDAPLGFNPHSGAEYDGMDGYGEDEE